MSEKNKKPSNNERKGTKRKIVKAGMRGKSRLSETKGKGRHKSKQLKTKDDDDDDDVNCIVCGELFSESRPGKRGCVALCAPNGHTCSARRMMIKCTFATIAILTRSSLPHASF